MRRWFLSYNSHDLGLMQGLEAALRRKDPDAHIYFAPNSVRAGGFWLPSLANEIAEATVFVLLVGEKGVGPWQVMEYYEALARRVKEHHEHPGAHDLPVVLLLLEGQPAPGLPFLRQLHWIVTPEPASERSLALLMEAAHGTGTRPRELWRHTAPYRGLAAMTESDADFFFGRARETIEVIRTLEGAPDKLPVLLGNSGVGKSSLAQAGVLAAFMRQAWPESAETAGPWPDALKESRRWCFLKLKPGTEPIRALVGPFLWIWQFDALDPKRAELLSGWVSKLLDGTIALRDLLDATEARYRDDLHQREPPAFLLYIDQGEELYVRAEQRQRQRFSEILACGLSDPRLRAMMSMRADFFGELQKDEPLYAVHRLINVPPLREAQLHEVVSRPAALLSARFETDGLAACIAHRAAVESTKDAGALPLLSYLLDDMWTHTIHRGDGVLRLPAHTIELGGVLVDHAEDFLRENPCAEEQLRRIFTLNFATVREDGEPTRRSAPRSEFSDEDWRLISLLADYPYRLVVTATPDGGETYAEVAHEAIFRRWEKLREWIAGEREFLAWRTGLEAAHRAWQATPDNSKAGALLMGIALAHAQSWLATRLTDISQADREFIIQSRKAAHQLRLRVQALVGVLAFFIVAGLIGWLNEAYLLESWRWFATIRPYMLTQVRPHVLSAAAERALKPADSFRECAKECPEMVVVPAGQFMMGSPRDERGRYNDEGPQHKVVFEKSFAVSKFEVTFEEWDACATYGDCDRLVNDSGFGRGRQPAINVSWDDAKRYVSWFSRMTGKAYRLLSEAEWEYAARGETQWAYSWGNEIGKGNANCVDCGSQWDNRRPAPVGSFAPNQFSIHDVHGNAWEWVEDCYHPNYNDAPEDGSAWTSDGCDRRVVRGGSWHDGPDLLRSAFRRRNPSEFRANYLGFRVGRTLSAGAGAMTVAPVER